MAPPNTPTARRRCLSGIALGIALILAPILTSAAVLRAGEYLPVAAWLPAPVGFLIALRCAALLARNAPPNQKAPR